VFPQALAHFSARHSATSKSASERNGRNTAMAFDFTTYKGLAASSFELRCFDP
jgi:hypothetical protein